MSRPKAKTERGEIRIGTIGIECYVLDDGRRVITQRGAVKALTARQNGGNSSGAGTGAIDRYLAGLPARFGHLQAVQQIEFDGPTGPAAGREASWFVEVCNAYVDSFFENELRPNQVHLAVNARAILSAAAITGFESMIDEATGYIPPEDDGPIARFVRHLFQRDARKWSRFWPDDVVREICKTFGIRREQAFPAPVLGVIGGIYSRRFGERHKALKEINPPGPNRNMHHQHFSDELAEFMRADMPAIRALLMASSSKAQFWELWENYVNGGGQLRFGW